MVFTSYIFLLFLAVLVLLYYILPKKVQWPLLLIASYVFYAWAGPVFPAYLAAVTLITYGAARFIGKNIEESDAFIKSNKETLSKEEKKTYKAQRKKVRMRFQVTAVVLCLAILAAVKYLNFFVSNISFIFGNSGDDFFIKIAVPLGISFYTLQALSYLFDVSRGTVKAEKNIFRYALFVGFFPQVIQGPISRFADLSKTLYGPHRFNREQFFFGLQRVLWGFFKKLVIADRLMPVVSTVFSDVNAYGGGYMFFGILFYTFQLYADFTGGIDITIGIAQMLGIRVMENFNLPYFSTSLKEYWRRWHISMCNWFREYIFYPLSSSKGMQKFSKFTKKHFGKRLSRRLPVYISSFVVWFATGIWHGASWNFILWGLANWLILMLSEEFEGAYDRFHKKFAFSNKKPYHVFRVIRTFALICVLNMFDCLESAADIFRAFFSIFSSKNWGNVFSGGLLELGIDLSDYIVAAAGLLLLLFVSLYKNKNGDVRQALTKQKFPVKAVVWSVLFIVVLIFGTYGIGYESSQFIYNRF